MLFEKKKVLKDDSEQIIELKEEVNSLIEENKKKDLDNELKVKRLDAEHEIIINEKNFEIKHLESEKVKELQVKLTEAEQKIAVFTKQVEMLDKIVDLNADVIDVKDLVTKLIDKLPEIKLTTLAGSTGTKKDKEN